MPPSHFPQAQGNEQGNEDDGDEIPQNHQNGKTGQRPPHQDATGMVTMPDRTPLAKSWTVAWGPKNAQGYGNGDTTVAP